MPFETTTPRLLLTRPTEQDRAFHTAVHSDPRLYAHAPHVLGTPATNAEFFDAIIAHWATEAFGYWVARDRDSGMPVGWVGVQRRDGHLNLYYRFVTEAQGRRLAREAARAAVAMATEWHPDAVVRALVKDHNEPSVRTAEAAGLVRTGEQLVLADDLPDEAPSSVFEAPQLGRVEVLDDALRTELLDLWCRVNDAGGSVGFLPGAPLERVAEVLATHEKQMAAGDAVAGALREPDGRLVGWAWWVRVPNPLLHHGRWLYRVMVDPARQRRGLGRLLMAGMHRVAREDGVELLQLGVRSGSGASAFYAQCGYTEVGRIPGAIRVAPGDDRDDVTMARRVDGRPPVAHGGG
ncbi:GNAT family N-acetyltransferase [Pedococcus bigeumensis]|uniref:GNAT family N-acetyltransferase n=1 Tax=Pedococcus bigeumensis TaxID=433644 RepID=A0A502D571_9MICO|nr:GNAT family N-acetyltransferase [Pedococcus bigeumensis]TPG19549.1 GNAT family N-acetyltransferase [Pedococcus bigeumensis]